MSTDSRVELEARANNIKMGKKSHRIYESAIPKAALWCVSRAMTLFMPRAIKIMGLLEGSIYISRIMCRILWPPKFCISLVNREEAAHTEGIYLTSLSRAEVRGYEEWVTPTMRWFIAPFLRRQVLSILLWLVSSCILHLSTDIREFSNQKDN